MGLTLTISLDKDIKELDLFFDTLRFKAITTAARQGLNRAAEQTRSFAIRELRKRINVLGKDLKGTKSKKGFVTVSKARGSNIATLESKVNFSGTPLPLILFLVGQKTPRVQTRPNASRVSRSVNITKNKKGKRPGIFVEKAKRGSRAFQVFRRRDPSGKTNKKFKVQSTPSVAEILRSKTNLMRKIENSAIADMQKAYDDALKNQLNKLKL